MTEVFPEVFERLKAILQPYAPALTVTQDGEGLYSLDGPFSRKWKRALFFGSAQIWKSYVSFYLMPVYMHPELLENITPELRKHMQGKSCFNFKQVEPELFEQLARLTKAGFEQFLRGYD